MPHRLVLRLCLEDVHRCALAQPTTGRAQSTFGPKFGRRCPRKLTCCRTRAIFALRFGGTIGQRTEVLKFQVSATLCGVSNPLPLSIVHHTRICPHCILALPPNHIRCAPRRKRPSFGERAPSSKSAPASLSRVPAWRPPPQRRRRSARTGGPSCSAARARARPAPRARRARATCAPCARAPGAQPTRPKGAQSPEEKIEYLRPR